MRHKAIRTMGLAGRVALSSPCLLRHRTPTLRLREFARAKEVCETHAQHVCQADEMSDCEVTRACGLNTGDLSQVDLNGLCQLRLREAASLTKVTRVRCDKDETVSSGREP